jgi:uncharacterized SAM-binding protein YcdF (DUF218 family)
LNAPEFGGETVGFMVLERLRYAARLARETGLPVLVSGGAPGTAGSAEAQLMSRTLKEDFGVPVRWVEDRSWDTAQNARLSADMLRAAGIKHVILVTHAMHMPRAMLEFSHAGLAPLAAPTGRFEAPLAQSLPGEIRRWVPSARAAYFASMASHEWLGLLVAKIRL